MLPSNKRTLYTDALKVPYGYVFDEAIATTFSLDPILLLQTPLYLTLRGLSAPENINDVRIAEDAPSNHKEERPAISPLALLESLRSYSKKISVFVQSGRIQLPRISNQSAILGLLEEMITEVRSKDIARLLEDPNAGVFHPKIWAIRFINSSDANDILYRLIILSKNMTTDMSWDLSLQIEGSPERRNINPENHALGAFCTFLAQLSKNKKDQDRANRFARELSLITDWNVPDGYDSEIKFYLPWQKSFQWKLADQKMEKIAIISPFCSDEVLQELVSYAKNKTKLLISNLETLNQLSEDTISHFEECYFLDEAAIRPDGEDAVTSDPESIKGLHAKVYLYENGSNTYTVMGSANATYSGLMGRNIEFLAELKGKKNKVGDISRFVDGLKEYLNNFTYESSSKEKDSIQQELDKLHTQLSECELSVSCQKGSKEGFYFLDLLLDNTSDLDFSYIDSATAWPITVKQEKQVSIVDITKTRKIRLGEFEAASLTGLIAFELKAREENISTRFVLNLKNNIPSDRDESILQTIINNKENFLSYLFMLLSERDQFIDFNEPSKSSSSYWIPRMFNGETPLLEELTRAYCRSKDKLDEIGKIIAILEKKNKTDIIPHDFYELWKIIQSSREM